MPITIQVIHLHTIHLIIQAIRATLDTRNTSKTFTLLIGLPRPELLHRQADIQEVLLLVIPLLVDIPLREVIRQQLVVRLIIPQAANLIHHTTRTHLKLVTTIPSQERVITDIIRVTHLDSQLAILHNLATLEVIMCMLEVHLDTLEDHLDMLEVLLDTLDTQPHHPSILHILDTHLLEVPRHTVNIIHAVHT